MLREVSRSAAHFMVSKHEVARRQSEPGTRQRDLEISCRVAGDVGADDRVAAALRPGDAVGDRVCIQPAEQEGLIAAACNGVDRGQIDLVGAVHEVGDGVEISSAWRGIGPPARVTGMIKPVSLV